MLGKYVRVKDGEPFEIKNPILWAQSFEHEDRQLQQTDVPGTLTAPSCWVSTVFLALDHNFHHSGPPVLWETMIFTVDPRYDNWQVRYTNEKEALDGHMETVRMIQIKPFQFEIETHAPMDHASYNHIREVWARDAEEALMILESESWAFGIRTIRAHV